MKSTIAVRPPFRPIQGNAPLSPGISNSTSSLNSAAMLSGAAPWPIPARSFSAISRLCFCPIVFSLRRRQLVEQSLSLSKPGPLDALPIARQRAFLLQKLPQPFARFLASVLRFQECRVHIERLGSIGVLHDLGEKRRCFLFPSRCRVSLGQHQLRAIGIVLRITANNTLEVRHSRRRVAERHQAQAASVEAVR